MRPLLYLLIYFNERRNFWRHATYLGYQIAVVHKQQFESPFDQKDKPKGVSIRSQDLIQRTSPQYICRVLSLSDCKYSLSPLSQTWIDRVGQNRIRRTFKLHITTSLKSISQKQWLYHLIFKRSTNSKQCHVTSWKSVIPIIIST